MAALRRRGRLWRTEQTYRARAARFARFIAPRSPRTADEREVGAFLSAFAVERRAGRSTQKQPLNALVFLFREGFGRELPEIPFQRAEAGRKVPTVLTRAELAGLFTQLESSVDPVSGERRRHQMSDAMFQAAIRGAARAAGITKRVTPHVPAASVCDAPVGGRNGYRDRAGFARARKRGDDTTLHACDAAAGGRRAVAVGSEGVMGTGEGEGEGEGANRSRAPNRVGRSGRRSGPSGGGGER